LNLVEFTTWVITLKFKNYQSMAANDPISRNSLHSDLTARPTISGGIRRPWTHCASIGPTWREENRESSWDPFRKHHL